MMQNEQREANDEIFSGRQVPDQDPMERALGEAMNAFDRGLGYNPHNPSKREAVEFGWRRAMEYQDAENARLRNKAAELTEALQEIADSGEIEAKYDHDPATDHNRLVRIASAAIKR